ncbi:cingulin-like protein 1 [Littorina saxatilis]|uniref:Uncharacterized protein n=1 Tax=Littorina saxatilis TaxID=31220 RepID=A0AAN9BJD6_9CAEN
MSREAKVNELKLKDRIKELETEVTSLKRRLDDLRKAKNTTILKREREIVEVGAPFGRRESQSMFVVDGKASELEKKLQDVSKSRDQEMDALRKKFAAEMEQVKGSSKDCGHHEELLFLRYRNEGLENENAVLMSETGELRDKIDALVTELSIKEAKWCEAEEQLNLKLKESWGEKYKEWMKTTEAKIADLQCTNQLLRHYLKKASPDGRDPTLDDPDGVLKR